MVLDFAPFDIHGCISFNIIVITKIQLTIFVCGLVYAARGMLLPVSGSVKRAIFSELRPPLETFTIACLTFCLLLTDRPIQGLLEYQLIKSCQYL